MICRDKIPRLLHTMTHWATKKLFLAAYEASDADYWQRRQKEGNWLSLGGILEYDTEVMAAAQEGQAPICLMTLRAASRLELQHATVKIKFKRSGVVCQQILRIDHFGELPVRKALRGIPVRLSATQKISGRRFGDVYIKLTEAVTHGGIDLASGRKVARIFRPTATDVPLHHYARRWGQYWNICAIHREQEELRDQWFRKLVLPAKQLWRPLRSRRAAFRLMTNPISLSLAFWLQNLFDAEQFRCSLAGEYDPSPQVAAGRAKS